MSDTEVPAVTLTFGESVPMNVRRKVIDTLEGAGFKRVGNTFTWLSNEGIVTREILTLKDKKMKGDNKNE